MVPELLDSGHLSGRVNLRSAALATDLWAALVHVGNVEVGGSLIYDTGRLLALVLVFLDGVQVPVDHRIQQDSPLVRLCLIPLRLNTAVNFFAFLADLATRALQPHILWLWVREMSLRLQFAILQDVAGRRGAFHPVLGRCSSVLVFSCGTLHVRAETARAVGRLVVILLVGGKLGEARKTALAAHVVRPFLSSLPHSTIASSMLLFRRPDDVVLAERLKLLERTTITLLRL